MKFLFLKVTYSFIAFFICCFSISNAQLCTGSLGDPIVNITFGSGGSSSGTALNAATTTYNFFPNDCPGDGSYTVRTSTANCFGNTWHTVSSDHTGDPNGYFMLINASNLPSDFYVDTVKNLCSSSTYQFAAWIMNVQKSTACGGVTIKPNVTFSIERIDGTVIQSYNTNDIATTANPTWVQYGFFFTTPVGVSDVVLRMRNIAPGGCGNDLALDDITFRRCGPLVSSTIVGAGTNSANVCQGSSQAFNISAVVSSGFTNPEFQWQQSFNNSAFTDIMGANALNYTISFLPTALIGTYKYRIAISEQGTSAVLNCRIISDSVIFNLNPKPIIAIAGDTNICTGTNLLLTASGAAMYNWIGSNSFTSNTAIVQINNATSINAGLYTVVGENSFGCQTSLTKTVIINPKPIASVSFVDTTICKNVPIILLASGGGTYSWFPATNISSTSVPNPTVTVSQTILYNVEVTNTFGCKDTAKVNVNVVSLPAVDAGPNQSLVGNTTVQLNGTITGSYSNFIWTPTAFLNNSNTLNPTAQITSDTKFYLTVNALRNCGTVLDSVMVNLISGFFIPNAFTPNADGKNDVWNIAALRAYPNHELKVYNRYGQVVFYGKAGVYGWDGKFNGALQPAGVYSFVLDLKDGKPLYKGSILLLQ
jgi:gliding motility-associated-like protein